MGCFGLTFFVVVEFLEELEQFLPVSPQDTLNLRWLLRVGNEDLASMSDGGLSFEVIGNQP
jgi:hypothetical protein